MKDSYRLKVRFALLSGRVDAICQALDGRRRLVCVSQ